MSILQPETPENAEKREPAGPVFGMALGAFFCYWVLTPLVYLGLTGHSPLSTTQGTSQADPLTILSPRDLVVLSVTAPVVGLISLIAGNLLLRERPFEMLGFTRDRLRRSWKSGLISAAIILPLMFVVLIVTDKAFQLIHYEHPAEHDLLRVLGGETSRVLRAGIVFSAIVLAPLFEEFFFRGMIQGAFALLLPRRLEWIAILIASIAFAAVHGAFWMMPPIFVLSLCLGYAYQRTRNLWVPIIVHASFNVASVILFLMR